MTYCDNTDYGRLLVDRMSGQVMDMDRATEGPDR